MRRARFGVWLAVVGLSGLLAIGCGGTSPTAPNAGGGSSSSPPPSGGTPTHGTMSATIDGASWTAADVKASLSNNRGSLTVTGVDSGSTQAIGFAAASPTPEANPLAPGRVLQIPGTTSNARLELFTNGFLQQTYVAAPGSGGSGTITINTLSSTAASGTFTFIVKLQSGNATKTITNGVFNVTF